MADESIKKRFGEGFDKHFEPKEKDKKKIDWME